MKNFFLSVPRTRTTKKKYVVFVSGQSNGVGRERSTRVVNDFARQGISTTFPAASTNDFYNAKPEGVNIYYRGYSNLVDISLWESMPGSWQPYELGVNSNNEDALSNYDMTLSLGTQLYSHFQEPIYVIKYAKSSSRLSDQSNTLADWAESGNLREIFTDLFMIPALEELMQDGSEIVPLFFVWRQGESDAVASSLITAYPASFESLRSYIIQKASGINVDLSQMHWGLYALNFSQIAGETSLNNTMAQMAANNPLYHFIDNSDKPRMSDLTEAQQAPNVGAEVNDNHDSYIRLNADGEDTAEIIKTLF